MSTPFQKNFRFLIARNGLTIRKLAEESGLSTAGITNLKNGAKPREATVEKLAALFSVDPWLLQFGDLTGGEAPEGASTEDGIAPFTRNFRKIMASRGVTVRALATALGMGTTSIQALRSGSIPRPSTVEKIASYFGVEPNLLAFGRLDKATEGGPTDQPLPVPPVAPVCPPSPTLTANGSHCAIPVISAANARTFLSSPDEHLIDYRTCWPGRTVPSSLLAAVQMTPDVAGSDIVAGDLLFLGTPTAGAKDPLVLAEGKTLVVGNLIELPPPLGNSVTFTYKGDEKVVVPCNHVLGEVLCRVRPYVAL